MKSVENFHKAYTSYLLKLMVCCLLNIAAVEVNGQSAIVIKYDWTSLNFKPVNSFNAHYWQIPIDLRMTFNNSFALVYVDHSSFNIENLRRQADGRLINHATFHDFTMGERFHEVNFEKDYKYLIKDSVTSWNWQFLNAEKKVLNKLCRAALSVNQKNDSVLVYFTTELGFQNGPIWYDSIPGVILEVFDQRRNAHIKAFKIREKNIDIAYPTEGTKVTSIEWKKISKEQHDKKYSMHH